MFNKFEFTIGLRYLRAKQKSGFISFISLVSIIGIALGVAALIIVLSVMNGFQKEIKTKIVGATSHMQAFDASGKLYNWQNLASYMQLNDKRIISYAPYVNGQALISFNNGVNGVLVRGIIAKDEAQVAQINQNMVKGSFDSLSHDSFNIIIGQDLAQQLGGIDVGDKITLITPNGQISPAGMIPRLKRFTVSGIFNTHMIEFDSSLTLINLHDAQVLFKMNEAVSGVRFKVQDIMQTNSIKEFFASKLPSNILISDWIDDHQNYFAAVELEKKMMFIILTLIVAVATFNLVSTLVMTVNDKKSDIAILRTMGATKKNIRNIFIIQGGISGIIGTLVGTILGVVVAINIGRIVAFFEKILHIKIINSSVYLIDYLPSEVIAKDVITILIIAISLSIIATIYPSKNAAKINPVETLRHE